jgi:hypothetical protein
MGYGCIIKIQALCNLDKFPLVMHLLNREPRKTLTKTVSSVSTEFDSLGIETLENGLITSDNSVNNCLSQSTIETEEKATCESFDIPSMLKRKLEELYNQSQLQAINDCLKTSGITLVQGPPGNAT